MNETAAGQAPVHRTIGSVSRDRNWVTVAIVDLTVLVGTQSGTGPARSAD